MSIALNPKDNAASSRLDLSLFPDTAVAYGALALVEGDLKYGGYNWRDSAILASVYYAAARRHLAKWFNGQEVDPITKVPHLASALACIAICIDASERGHMTDDRPPRIAMDTILNRSEMMVKHLQEKFPRQHERHTEVKDETHNTPR